MPSPEPNKAAAPFALVGWFASPGQLVQACEALRDAGYRRFDAHTPFPVHGLDGAMGLRPSRLPWIVFAMGLVGGLGAFLLQMWTMGVDYPQNISGKPHFAWQAYVPVTFEATILFAAFGAFFGLWALNRLPRLFHPVMQAARFEGVSDDRFLVSVEAADPLFDAARTRELLERLGARALEEVAP